MGALTAVFVGFAEEGTDPEADLREALVDGTWIVVVDWVELDLAGGPARLSLFDAALSGTFTQPELVAGEGEVDLLVQSFTDPYGATVQANDAAVADGVLFAQLSSLRVPTIGMGGSVVVLPAQQVLLEMALVDCGGGVCSATTTVPGENGDVEVPDARIGGLVLLEDYVAGLDAYLRRCTCAAVDPALPVLELAFDAAAGYDVQCTANSGDGGGACGADDDAVCQNIDTFCGATSLFPSTADVDLDDDGHADAYSFGARLGVSPVTILGVGQ